MIRVHVTVLFAVSLVNCVERFEGSISVYGCVHENFESSERPDLDEESETEFEAVEQEVLNN